MMTRKHAQKEKIQAKSKKESRAHISRIRYRTAGRCIQAMRFCEVHSRGFGLPMFVRLCGVRAATVNLAGRLGTLVSSLISLLAAEYCNTFAVPIVSSISPCLLTATIISTLRTEIARQWSAVVDVS